jgi:hypothetical protein
VAHQAHDVGRTSGGGSLGHVQPSDVREETPIRNNADERPKDPHGVSDRDGERDTTSDPVMPADDSTLNTKI